MTNFNGPGRELSGHHSDEEVYCVQCGTTFVYANGRDCPSCTLAERQEQIEDRLDQIDRDLDIIDSGGS